MQGSSESERYRQAEWVLNLSVNTDTVWVPLTITGSLLRREEVIKEKVLPCPCFKSEEKQRVFVFEWTNINFSKEVREETLFTHLTASNQKSNSFNATLCYLESTCHIIFRKGFTSGLPHSKPLVILRDALFCIS